MKGVTCKEFRDSIRTCLNYLEDRDEDMIYHHILDCIGALTHIQNCSRPMDANEESLAAIKRRVFWHAVQQVAGKELENVYGEEFDDALSTVLDVFPEDESTRLDVGRSWMPLHLAVSLPSVSIQEIKSLITAQPEAVSISMVVAGNMGYNTIHLACIANARVEVVHLLQAHFPLWGESLTECFRFTPLHLAVKYSSSLALVQELIRLYPPAVEMEDMCGNLPLHWISTKSSEGPQILQALLDAAPHTARTKNNFMEELPLHCLLQKSYGKDSPTVLKMASILIAAYPDAVDIRNVYWWLPIHHAAVHAPVQVFQMIAEKNMANLSDDRYAVSATKLAVQNQNFENLRYIHSVKPELLMEKSIRGGKAVINCLEPVYLTSPVSDASDILRFLLRHYRTINTETTTDDEDDDDDSLGYREFYETLSRAEEVLDMSYPRRLLLLAGHPSLCLPEVLRDLNYSARRGAQLLFYHHHHHHHPPPAPAGTTAAAARDTRDAADNIFSRIRDGPGSKELIRTIVGFL